MPQALAIPAASAAFGAGAPLGVVNAIAGVGLGGALVKGAFFIGTSAALSYATARLTAQKIRPSDGQLEIKQPIPPRLWHYGEVLVAGPLGMFDKTEIDKHDLCKIVLICGREIDSYRTLFLDDEEVTIDSEGWVDNGRFIVNGGPEVNIGLYLGTDDQTADQELIDRFPTQWSADHRLRGIAYARLFFSGDEENAELTKMYPRGDPKFKAVIRGAKLYDPRLDVSEGGTHRLLDKTTWEYSDNAVLATLDWLLQAEGWGFPSDMFYWPDWIAKANLADEDVPLKNGGTEKRYCIATTVDLTESRKQVLARLLEAWNGSVYLTRDGLIGCRGGEFEEPTVSFDLSGDHVLSSEFGELVGRMARTNIFKLKYMSPDHKFTEVETEPWVNENDPEYIDGREISRALDLLQVPSHGQARRLAKIRMFHENPAWIGGIRTNYSGLDAVGEQAIELTDATLGIESNLGFPSHRSFNGAFAIDDGEVTLRDDATVEMSCRSVQAEAYEWDAATEEGDPPPTVDSEPFDTGWDEDAQAFFDACNVAPLAERKALYHDLVTGLKTDGVWTKLKWLSIEAAHDEQAGRLNIVAPSQTLTAVNAPGFTVDRGFAGNGTTSYLRLNIALNALSGITQDSIAGMFWSGTNSGDAGIDFGSPSVWMLPRNGVGNFSSACASSGTDNVAQGTSLGSFGISRTGSGSYKKFVDGAAVSTPAKASIALTAADVYVGAWHDGAGAISNYSTRRNQAVALASGLTDAEMLSLHTRVRTFLTAVGAP